LITETIHPIKYL